MKTVIQRVQQASVTVDAHTVGKINAGLCVLVGIAPDDTPDNLNWMANKMLNLRIFADENGKMNKSVIDIQGAVLLVSQFTLLADCVKGRRPSFIGAGDPNTANALFEQFVDLIKSFNVPVQTGVFGAEMLVQIANDGPATFILESPKK